MRRSGFVSSLFCSAPAKKLLRSCFHATSIAIRGTIRIHLCLGATAATALIAPGFRMQRQRGQWISSKYRERTLATWHPSSILRLPEESQRQARMAELIEDLRKVQQQP